MEEFIKKNAVSDMIAIMNKNISAKLLSSEEQKKLIKHCAVSIGRVAEVDEKQVKLKSYKKYFFIIRFLKN